MLCAFSAIYLAIYSAGRISGGAPGIPSTTSRRVLSISNLGGSRDDATSFPAAHSDIPRNALGHWVRSSIMSNAPPPMGLLIHQPALFDTCGVWGQFPEHRAARWRGA